MSFSRLCAALLCVAFARGPGNLRAADTPADAESLLPDPRDMARVEASVDRALEYLVKAQNPDGSFPNGGHANAVTALSLLAFMGRGHEPGRGPFKPAVDRAVAFLVSRQDKNGYFPASMYEHGLTTLALTEAYGFIPTPEMRAVVQRALDVILKAQSPLGGWRYAPTPTDQDLSVTVMQVVALRSAMNAHFDVPQATVDKAIKYVKSCAVAAGGFSYTTGGGVSVAQSAAGPLSLQLLGAFDDPTVAKSLAVLAAHKANETPALAYFYYTNYYAMQSHFQAGGDAWAQWHPKVRDLLLSNQAEDGTFPAQQEQAYNGPTGKCYSTAMGCLILEVYMHYLPAYQR